MNVLPLAKHGIFQTDIPPPYKENFKVPLQCADGYTSEIENSIVINKNGILVWDPPFAECIPFLNSLPTAINGYFKFDGKRNIYFLGDLVTLKCNANYAVASDTAAKVIMENGVLKWDPQSAECKPYLTGLPTAINGHFEFNENRNIYFEGDKVSLKCNDGYTEPSNPTANVIMQNGVLKWDLLSAECKPYLTSLPTAINGHFEFNENRKIYFEGDKVSLKCNAGYTIPSNPTAEVIMDQNSLKWDPLSATCIPINCGPPKQIDNGTFIGTDFTFGKKIEFQCNDGFQLVNLGQKPEFYCGALGEWMPPIPDKLKCEITCPALQAPTNGKLESLVNGLAKFSCDYGYLMVGDSERKCQPDGTWSGKEVKCIKMAQQPIPCVMTPEMIKLKSYQKGATLILDCGNQIEEVLKCENGKWSKDPPYCIGTQVLENPLNRNELVGINPLDQNNAKPKVAYIPMQQSSGSQTIGINLQIFWILAIFFMVLTTLTVWLKHK